MLLRVRISFGPHGRVVVKARLPLCGRPVFSVGIISWSMFAVSNSRIVVQLLRAVFNGMLEILKRKTIFLNLFIYKLSSST